MCGIAGAVVAPGGQPDTARLTRMAAALGHRGPDGSGVEVIGQVGLAHTRLAVIDPTPAGRQPMPDSARRWWVTYNGEIFNHLGLRRELPARGWRGGSDTETLVEAFAAWGDSAIGRCNGLFAYAALDTVSRRLLLVRDRFGVKPLYFARHGGALWFASEIGALMEAGIPRAVDADVLRQAMAMGWANGPQTPVAGVTRVMPGTLVEISLDTLAATERRWFSPYDMPDPARADELRQMSEAERVAALETALRTSVRRRLMSDVPLGTMCSGGIDSSLITALAAEAGPVHAFNARVVDQPDKDEGPWAEEVATHVGAELHTVEMTAVDWRAGLVAVTARIEYPLTHESSVPMAEIARLARSCGVKVLLSGEGADELFGGYDWLHRAAYRDLAARTRRAESALRGIYRAAQAHGILASRLERDPRPGPSAAVTRWEAEQLRRAGSAYAHLRGPERRLAAHLAGDLALYLPHLLNRQDKSTMMHSIETRVPFLDPDVVALALNLPVESRVEPERKAPLRAIGTRMLPPAVMARPKIGFGFDTAAYLGANVRLEFIRDGLLREALGVDRVTWGAEADRMRGGLRPVTGEIWIRTVVEGQSPDVVEGELWATAPRGRPRTATDRPRAAA